MADHAGPAHDHGEPVGGIGEEAAKLLAALQGWSTDSAPGGEHLGTGGDACRWCPVCQVISAVRGTPPEVREHLAAAAGSLVKAVAGLLDTPVPDGAAAHGRRAAHRAAHRGADDADDAKDCAERSED